MKYTPDINTAPVTNSTRKVHGKTVDTPHIYRMLVTQSNLNLWKKSLGIQSNQE
jgi:hypothetical protein